ncbi:MAG: JAB domain-containing protein [Sphingomonas sp.]
MTQSLPTAATERYVPDAEAARALFAPIADKPREIAAFAYLDPEWRLLGVRHSMSGASDGVDAPIREVVSDVIAFGAAAVVMAHNHPSGDTAPSAADFMITRRLSQALQAVGVRLVDHLIVAGDQVSSLRNKGFL